MRGRVAVAETCFMQRPPTDVLERDRGPAAPGELPGVPSPGVLRHTVRAKSVLRNVVLAGRGRCRVRHIAGPARAPTLLLLHGWTATADLNWGRCYAAQAGHYEVIAPDLRGHGGGVRGRFSLEECADDAAALLATLGRGPAIVVGYSLGGPVATVMWRRHPKLVAGLVLCSHGGVLRRDQTRAARTFSDRQLQTRGRLGAPDRLGSPAEHARREMVRGRSRFP